MSRVRFNLRSNKSKNHSIQLVYRIKGSGKLVVGTGLYIPEKYWSRKRMRAKEVLDYEDYSETNALLDMWERAASESMSVFLLKKQEPTKEQLKNAIMKSLSGTKRNGGNLDVAQFFEEFIQMKKSAGVTESTVKVYQNVLNHFNKFRKVKMYNRSLEFQDMGKKTMMKFRNYLEESLEPNTVHKVIKKLRTVLNDANQSEEYELPKSYKHKDIQVSYVPQPKIYLNEEEIQQIETVNLDNESRLDKVRDRFIIGLKTGLRFSDFSRLNVDFVTRHEGREIVKMKTRKTGQFVNIPLHEKVSKILNKYKGYPPLISEQNFNYYLKELCEKAGIVNKVSKEEKGQQVIYAKYQLVSSHICRRSFATNAYKAGVHPKLLMSITSHSSIKQFMEYICIDKEEALNMLLDHPYFKKS